MDKKDKVVTQAIIEVAVIVSGMQEIE